MVLQALLTLLHPHCGLLDGLFGLLQTLADDSQAVDAKLLQHPAIQLHLLQGLLRAQEPARALGAWRKLSQGAQRPAQLPALTLALDPTLPVRSVWLYEPVLFGALRADLSSLPADAAADVRHLFEGEHSMLDDETGGLAPWLERVGEQLAEGQAQQLSALAEQLRQAAEAPTLSAAQRLCQERLALLALRLDTASQSLAAVERGLPVLRE